MGDRWLGLAGIRGRPAKMGTTGVVGLEAGRPFLDGLLLLPLLLVATDGLRRGDEEEKPEAIRGDGERPFCLTV